LIREIWAMDRRPSAVFRNSGNDPYSCHHGVGTGFYF
jgi:hypothetical protein